MPAILMLAVVMSLDLVTAISIVMLAIVLILSLVQYLRQGRNEVLEQWIALGRCGPAASFGGTLAIEEDKPGRLRLSKRTSIPRGLSFRDRWLSAVGPQAIFDEIVFDSSRAMVELKKKGKVTTISFSALSAVRMREASSEQGSRWHLDLVRVEGKAVLFATSEQGNRRMTFENSAGLARAVSIVTSLPVQVVVAGGAWTPGWPPKTI